MLILLTSKTSAVISLTDKKLNNENIRVASNLPGLNSHIKLDVNAPVDKAYWYIKFNIPLDKDYVNKDTTNVTDTDGYLMLTYIYYDEKENLIVVIPKDSYDQDRYYLLNISRDVRSANGQKLKREIHILFKLLDSRISSFKILDAATKVPKPKPRPANYDELQELKKLGIVKPKSKKSIDRTPPRTKAYSFEKGGTLKTSETPLQYADIKVNIVPALVGLVVILASLFTGIAILIITCIIGCFAGIGITLSSLLTAEGRSNILYNRGVSNFRREKYKNAEEQFKKALALNENNEMAESALDKVSFYL